MKKIDMQALQKHVDYKVNKMYEVISELEDVMSGGSNYVDDMYEIPRNEVLELEDYLESYIESIHICICTMFEVHEFNTLYSKYLEEYDNHSKTKLKYYSEVDVFDSPIWGMMSKYYKALTFIDGFENPVSINVNSDYSNKIENINTNNNEVNLEVVFSELKNIMKKIDLLEIEDENFNSIKSEVMDVIENDSQNKGKLKTLLNRLSGLFISTGEEFVKEELKNMIPVISKGLLTILSSLL